MEDNREVEYDRGNLFRSDLEVTEGSNGNVEAIISFCFALFEKEEEEDEDDDWRIRFLC